MIIATVRKEIIMTKYEMVAKLKMLLNGNYNSADVQSVIDALNEEINKEKNNRQSITIVVQRVQLIVQQKYRISTDKFGFSRISLYLCIQYK